MVDDEEGKLFETGDHNLHALQHLLVVCFRARDESRKLCWGDIVLDVDAETGHVV